MNVALFISPHLDDVAFSCGGTLARLLRGGWECRVCTIFTASVPEPRGFALRCQTDKGLAPDADYMRLRRAEDAEFARVIGGVRLTHLEFREAPHRGYESAAELFAGERESDDVWREAANELSKLAREIVRESWLRVVFAPQGLGNHVDHLQTVRAALAMGSTAPLVWYRDTPYAIRDPHAAPSPLVPVRTREMTVGIDDEIETKINGSVAYGTQIGFQFGGADAVGKKLREFHSREAQESDAPTRGEARPRFAERFLAPASFEPPAPLGGRASR